MAVDFVLSPNLSTEAKRNMIRVGVIGYGYWGPNVVRNLHGLESACVEMVCDKSSSALARVRKTYPGVLTTSDANDVLRSPNIDAVAVITPVWTHYELAKTALENGKHVFVEKPLTSNRAQAEAQINRCQIELLLLRYVKNLLEFDQSIIQWIAIIRTAKVS